MKSDSATLKTSTEDRLGRLAEELRNSLYPVVREVAGPAIRPSMLIRRLKIDKSLASRLSRAFRAEEALEFLHLLPAPTGLRIVLNAAARAKTDPEARLKAEASVERYQALIDETPGGRATLGAAISASSQEARDRNERSAKQAVYKSMSYLLGLRCESVITTFIIQPSESNDTMVDCIDLHHRVGMRRLRPTAPVGLFNIRLHPGADDDSPWPAMETLDGDPMTDVRSYLLPEFSSEPLPDLDLYKEEDARIIALAEDEPSFDSPLTITSAAILRNIMERYRTPECRDEWRGYLLHYPCKMIVRDILIHEDLYVGTVPDITHHVPSPKGAETIRHPGQHGRLNTLDIASSIENVGMGIENVGVKEVPAYSRLVRHAFDRTGWDPGRFRLYRTRVIYPVSMILTTWWFSLPDPPA